MHMDKEDDDKWNAKTAALAGEIRENVMAEVVLSLGAMQTGLEAEVRAVQERLEVWTGLDYCFSASSGTTL